jgi:glyoxylase-like metal-dependent hydrolase (beta-lactamase superfamily II)
MLFRSLAVGPLRTNCYVMACERTRQAFVVDPGGDPERILEALRQLDATLVLIALTHYHFDHVLAADALRSATTAPIAIGRGEAKALQHPPVLFRFYQEERVSLTADRLLDDGDILTVGDLLVQVLATPGHSPAGVSYWVESEGVVYSGDTLLCESVGRVDFVGGNADELLRSIREELFALPEETLVYPGHGPRTTIGHERRHNPWTAQ